MYSNTFDIDNDFVCKLSSDCPRLFLLPPKLGVEESFSYFSSDSLGVH